MTPAASPAMDCCVALGADLRRGRLRGGGPESGLWRTWLATSSLLPGRPRAYLAVRVTLALFMDAVLLGSALLMAWAKGKWCIYLTHWSLTAVALYLTLAAFATWTAQRAAPGEPPPWWLPALWSLHAVALPASCLVFLLFWLLVYPTNHAAGEQTITYFVHGINFAVMAADGALTRAPYHFLYLWSAWLVYAVIYVLFTLAYFLAGGTNEYGVNWIYAVLDWSTRASAHGAGVIAGLVVFLAVPALGLLSYWLLFLRRKHVDKEAWPWAPPACAGSPPGPAPLLLGRLRASAPRLARWLPVAGAACVGGAIAASTALTVTRQDAFYWRARVTTGAVVPYVSDAGTNWPAYFVFAGGLTLGAAIMGVVVRALYEGMDHLLLQADDAAGVYVYHLDEPPAFQAVLPASSDGKATQLVAPCQEERINGGGSQGRPAHEHNSHCNGVAAVALPPAQRPVCCCSTGRWAHCCCCCCSHGLRMQGRAAYISGLVACAGMPLVGWCGENKELNVHLIGAALTFVGFTIHWCLFTRMQAVRCTLPVATTRGDVLVTRARAALLWGTILVGILGVGLACLALGRRARWAIDNIIFALAEFIYVGVLGAHCLSLVHEMSAVIDGPPPAGSSGAKANGHDQA